MRWLFLCLTLASCAQVARSTMARPIYGQPPAPNRITLGGSERFEHVLVNAGEVAGQASLSSLSRTEACVVLAIAAAVDNDTWDVRAEVNNQTTLDEPFSLADCDTQACMAHDLIGHAAGGEVCFPTGTADVRQLTVTARKGAVNLVFGWDFVI